METAHLDNPHPPLWLIHVQGQPGVRISLDMEKRAGDTSPTSAEQIAVAGTVINANPHPFARLSACHSKVNELLGGDPFTANEAPGIMVLGQYLQGNPATLTDAGFAATASRIDGFQIKGSIAGGGISVFNKANDLRISNNRVIGNQGSFVGGIALGMHGTLAVNYDNPNITIELNQILSNDGVNGRGGIADNAGNESTPSAEVSKSIF